MAHTPHTTHHTTQSTITLMNDAIDKHAAHRRHQHITSQSYNSREAYDTRRARAYITELWQTHHTPIANAIHQHADKPTPRWQYHQLPPSTAQPTPIAPPTAYTSKQLCIVTDDTHTLLVAHCRVERTDYSVTIITRARQFRAERHTPSADSTYTYDTDSYTGAELTALAKQYHAHIYKLV